MSWSYIPGSLLRDDTEVVPMNIYRERAALIAFLTKHYPAVYAYNDPAEPAWPVIYISTPEGQLSWHISPDDLGLFPFVYNASAEPPTWDGHTTEEKYERLGRLTRSRSVSVAA